MADKVMKPSSSYKSPGLKLSGNIGKIVGPKKAQMNVYNRKNSNPNKGISGQLK